MQYVIRIVEIIKYDDDFSELGSPWFVGDLLVRTADKDKPAVGDIVSFGDSMDYAENWVLTINGKAKVVYTDY